MEVDVAFLLLALALNWALTFLTSRDRIADYRQRTQPLHWELQVLEE